MPAQRKQKETYDCKHTPEELPVGTEAMGENTVQKDRKGGKLDDMFKGNHFIHLGSPHSHYNGTDFPT